MKLIFTLLCLTFFASTVSAQTMRSLWLYEGGWVEDVGDGNWEEKSSDIAKDVGKITFKESEKSDKFIELRDASRQMTVRLFDDRMVWRLNDAGDWNFSKSGHWKGSIAKVETDTTPSTNTLAMPAGMKATVETMSAPISKVFSVDDNGARFRAYVVRWNNADVVVGDPLGMSDKKEGETLTFMVQKMEMPFGGSNVHLVQFMMMDLGKLMEVAKPKG